MSASTRTVQQPLGIGQLGAALVVIALALIVAVAVALGSVGTTTKKAAPAAPPIGYPPAGYDHGWSQAGPSTNIGAPAGIGYPPAGYDHGWSQAGTSSNVGAPPVGYDHGSSELSIGTAPKTGGFVGDPGFAPRSPAGPVAEGGRKGIPFTPIETVRSGSNGPRLRAN